MIAATWTSEQQSAMADIAASTRGQVVRSALTAELSKIHEQLVMNNDPEQVRRLQGEARALTNIITLFTPHSGSTAAKG